MRRADASGAFTLVEMLVSMAVLAVLIGLILRLVNGAASITGLGQAQMDTDAQARALLNRMGVDIGAMIRRTDVDYYLKGRPTTNTQGGSQGTNLGANDQIAFYSEVPGYFPTGTSTTAQSSVALIAYRVNGNTLHMERLCKGLSWNGGTISTGLTMFFLPVPLASPLPSPLPSPMPSVAPTPAWKIAADPSAADPNLDYEELGPQVFRFEYFYVLKGQTGAPTPAPSPASNPSPILSIVPWYASAPALHTSLNGLQDVAGIGVVIAVIDPKSRTLVSQAQLAALVNQMEDAPASMASVSDVELQWQQVINASTLPRPVVSSIRLYTRCFTVNPVAP